MPNINTNISRIENRPSVLNTPNQTEIQMANKLLAQRDQPTGSHIYGRKNFCKKLQKHRQIIDNHSIPLTLATSLHSNFSWCNEDDFSTKYILKMFKNDFHL